ncbi:MAG: cation:proton antiporter [Bacteroidales bacterium]|nr:cation:proton antiporter [Bacteroidales bacterium]
MLLSAVDLQLPLTDPVLKFLIILLIILVIPILSDRIKIPHLLGMIIAGVVIGPNGFNLLTRDSSIILSGTAGLLYIMFLSGLEIHMIDFKRNASRSTLLGLYGFIIPMVLGTLAGIYVLNFSVITSVLLASMFASHTLITYPIISKFGISKHRAVNISVSSTLVTNTLALTVLAVIVGITSGELNNSFWFKLIFSYIAFSAVILFLFPVVSRWFFKRFSDNISQYIFVLAIVFLGAVLSKFAGIEAIIGAFLAGLSLNRLIPRTSPLMNRIDFVGNAIFIPFFLIGVGMLIDFRAFVKMETVLVALVMTIVATAGKYISAWLVQKNFRFTKDERRLIFGLTNSQAAATLAAVTVGYTIITGYTADGEPVRLLNDSILNGTIIMILVTCTISSFFTQRGAQNIALSELTGEEQLESTERILIPVSNPGNIDELVSLGTIIKSRKNRQGFFSLNIINAENAEPEKEELARGLLDKAKVAASATDIDLKTILRYDISLANGITNTVRENSISDLLLGLHVKNDFSDSFFGRLTEEILSKCKCATYIYRPLQPISTVKRHLVIIPEDADTEAGFSFWLSKVWNIANNTGTKIGFFAPERTLNLLKEVIRNHPIDAEFNIFTDLDSFLAFRDEVKDDDNMIIVLSRKNSISYQPAMERIPVYLDKYFRKKSFLIIYPAQSLSWQSDQLDLTNPSLLEAIERIDLIGKTIARIISGK